MCARAQTTTGTITHRWMQTCGSNLGIGVGRPLSAGTIALPDGGGVRLLLVLVHLDPPLEEHPRSLHLCSGAAHVSRHGTGNREARTKQRRLVPECPFPTFSSAGYWYPAPVGAFCGAFSGGEGQDGVGHTMESRACLLAARWRVAC